MAVRQLNAWFVGLGAEGLMPIVAESLIPRMFLPQLVALRQAIFVRVLPAFDHIEAEADEIQAKTLDRLQEYTNEDSDPADIAEAAFEAGLGHFELLTATRQTIMNTFAISISHLFEQQRHFLTHNTVFDSEPSSPKREIKFIAMLDSSGIDSEGFAARPRLEELELVANVAKHAEGRSAEQLRVIRPDLFVAPSIRGNSDLVAPTRPVHAPLMGDDLYVQPEDLRAYLDTIEAFWRFVMEHLAPHT